MKEEKKICRGCGVHFGIEPEDFLFYEKIQVPPPTMCPECRMIRRMIWRNERVLYKRKSDRSGEEIISQHGEDAPFPVYGVREYFSRSWEVPSVEYDPGRSFFEQFGELMRLVPRSALLTDLQSMENGSVYQNASSRNKNCYMVSAAGDNEDCMYGNNVDYCKNVVDALGIRQSEYVYDSVDCMACSNTFFSEECRACVNGYFLFECKGCTDCFGCVHLRNKSHYWFNERLSRKEYEKRLGEFKENTTVSEIEEYKKKLEELKLRYPLKFAHTNPNSTSTCTGDYITDSKNVKNSFNVVGSENSRYCAKLVLGKECYDMNDWGDPGELCYESITVGKGAHKVFFSSNCWPECREIEYCDSCASSHHLFGCIGVKDGSYMILNRQYSEDEFHALKKGIVEDMKRGGEYGEFFPRELSPYAYNETIAQEYFPLSKEKALEKGFLWKEAERREHVPSISVHEIPERVGDVSDGITGEVVRCAHKGECNHQCTGAFKVTPQELAFYRHKGIPIPHTCPNCRHHERLKKRNPFRLWERRCMCGGDASEGGTYKNTAEHFHGKSHCPNTFQTTYAPGRKETIYCEECYNQEII